MMSRLGRYLLEEQDGYLETKCLARYVSDSAVTKVTDLVKRTIADAGVHSSTTSTIFSSSLEHISLSTKATNTTLLHRMWSLSGQHQTTATAAAMSQVS
jgi:hypothetical protein